jgi:hypothetical protein
MATAEVVQVIQGVSVTIASLVAVFGIDAWRREYIGRRQMELAEEVLALFYQARDVIHSIRNPFSFAGEGESRKTDPAEQPEVREALNRAYVLFERYEQHIELFSKIASLRYRFMAQIGVGTSRPFDDLNSVIRDMLLAARRLGRYWTRENHFNNDEDRDRQSERIHQAEAIFWEDNQDPDPIQLRVDAAVSEIEETCRAILESRGTLFGLINLPLRPRKHD